MQTTELQNIVNVIWSLSSLVNDIVFIGPVGQRWWISQMPVNKLWTTLDCWKVQNTRTLHKAIRLWFSRFFVPISIMFYLTEKWGCQRKRALFRECILMHLHQSGTCLRLLFYKWLAWSQQLMDEWWWSAADGFLKNIFNCKHILVQFYFILFCIYEDFGNKLIVIT